MKKLLGSLVVIFTFYIFLTIVGMWFNLDLQEAALLNKTLFGVLACSLFTACVVDVVNAVERFIGAP